MRGALTAGVGAGREERRWRRCGSGVLVVGSEWRGVVGWLEADFDFGSEDILIQ
jgi:hypothetical protein